MNKIWIIIKREYLTRVRKKTFIISTLLFPLLYLGLIFGMGFIAEKSKQNLHVAVIDSSGYFSTDAINKQNLADNSSVLTLVKSNTDKIIADHNAEGYDGYIIIPAINWKEGSDSLFFKANKSYGSGSTAAVEAKLNRIWNEIKNDSLQIDTEKQTILVKSKLRVSARNIKDENANVKTAEGIGYVAGFLIYFILLIYGSQVMMGVMEEKTNRIAEVIVSSVKPFQMMLGKILGIGLVALTQFFLWIAFVLIVYNVGKASGAGGGMATEMVGSMQKMFASVNVPLILFCFGFYFLAGFFFYASLYGAIGSAVNEDMREAQSLSFPITMLVIISIALMTAAISDPTGPIAVWGSIIPFSSPIVMMARIPYGVPGTVPVWQLALSMGLLILGFIFTVWFAGKIYRTGILMYGKKPSWKEMIRWAFRKN
ncbi:MAG: ABC transporter permease [Chitinophagaceae bacterium]|nr:ABC transporter permease [Chitinophagaceae bacterium]HQV61746.1 ABC transporter permease [Chitinophagaceae bacterium]HQV86653.1 ABC transporter permease [Chitinophagaceae bacterium]HQX72793.1 ABC transporter permease [Chitinophagaceae bacterium]HQZ74016.1 ABC transporter permease [Chitinophagaceae bacterium]